MVAQIKTGPGLKKAKSLLKRGSAETRKAIAQAIDDTTRQLRTRASREIRRILAVPAAVLKPRLRRQLAYRKGRPRLVGKLYISERPIGLSAFVQTQTDAGVEVKIRKGGAPKVYRHAFGPNTKLAGGVFRRVGRKRLPIERAPGVPLAQNARAQGAVERVNAMIPSLLKTNVQRRLNLLKLRAEKRGG